MTHLVDRRIRVGVTWLFVLGVLALLLVPASRVASRVAAQAAVAQADRWEPAIRKFEEADTVTPPPQNAIVFIGASSIVRWNLRESFPELGPQAINRGFGGSLAADSTRYADRVVIPYKPRMVVFYAGDNDVEANHTPAQIAGDFTAFERKVHAALPDTEIVFISIKPSIRRFPWIEQIKGANALVRGRRVVQGESVQNRGRGSEMRPVGPHHLASHRMGDEQRVTDAFPVVHLGGKQGRQDGQGRPLRFIERAASSTRLLNPSGLAEDCRVGRDDHGTVDLGGQEVGHLGVVHDEQVRPVLPDELRKSSSQGELEFEIVRHHASAVRHGDGRDPWIGGRARLASEDRHLVTRT